MTVLLAKFRNRRDADFVAGLIKRFRRNTKILKGASLEDMYFGELIEEGMREKGEISEAEFSAYLKKRIRVAK